MSKASKDLAEKAMQAADETFKTWKKVDPAIRAACKENRSYWPCVKSEQRFS
ncbi:hypothetical protein [Lysinibacillus fusiformis]|uniref:hypothetical protein n=1 Tax=Lysinibacillus fusiformis TaxID=28031 RepID=UPI003F639A53